MRRAFALAAVLFVAVPSFSQSLPAQGIPIPVPLPLFPPNNWWNVDISNAPLDPNSATLISNIGGSHVHADWGGDVDPQTLYGFPYIVVDGSQTKVAVDFNPYGYPDQSDGVDLNTLTSYPFYPIPTEAITQNGWIEGGPSGNQKPGGDRHMLIVDATHNYLYELYDVFYDTMQGKWEGGSGAFWDMNTNNQRPDTWTSADAAGLQILPGLVRYDEVYGPNEINHAFRFTLPRSLTTYVFPALHAGPNAIGGWSYGMRLRLKSTKNCSAFPAPEVAKICRALQKYGLIFADQGSSMYISGSYNNGWNMAAITNATNGLQSLTSNDFEVVQLGWNPSVSLAITGANIVGSGDAAPMTVTAYSATYDTPNHHMSYTVATSYRGTVHFTSTDGSATLPIDYTFTPADNGAHTFSTTFRTAGGQTLYATDASTATVTGSHLVVVGPATPTGFVATASGTSSVSLAWNPVAGAAQYEVYKLTSTNPYASALTTASTSTSDSGVAAGQAYVYKVRAIDASSRYSPFSVPDVATTVAFTDEPLTQNVTPVKAVHLTELRSAVNLMRVAGGLAAATFTDSSLASVTIKAVHIQELRTALDQARAALGVPPLAYTDPTVTAGTTVVKKVHVQELRAGIK